MLISLTGCQAAIYGTASEFDMIDVGMDREQVVFVLGSPVSRSINPDTGRTTLVYKKMRHAISEWPRMYEVVFEDGKVIGFGEKNSEVSVNNF